MNSIWKREMGEAISYEDVMSLMTVIFVLFFIIMIPLVNLEKARLERAEVDPYWGLRVSKIMENTVIPSDGWKYKTPFELEDKNLKITKANDSLTYIEAADEEGLLVIIQYNVKRGTFRSMRVDSKGGSINFLRGIFGYSRGAKEFFREIQETSYGDMKFAKELNREYRLWTTED